LRLNIDIIIQASSFLPISATIIQLFSSIYIRKLSSETLPSGILPVEVKITRGLLGRMGDVNITRALRKFYFQRAVTRGQTNFRVRVSLSRFSMRKSVVKSLSAQ